MRQPVAASRFYFCFNCSNFHFSTTSISTLIDFDFQAKLFILWHERGRLQRWAQDDSAASNRVLFGWFWPKKIQLRLPFSFHLAKRTHLPKSLPFCWPLFAKLGKNKEIASFWLSPTDQPPSLSILDPSAILSSKEAQQWALSRIY